MILFAEWFGEDVSQVQSCVYVGELDCSGHDLLTYVVILPIDELTALVILRIMREVDACLVVFM